MLTFIANQVKVWVDPVRVHNIAYAIAYVTGHVMRTERHVKLFRNGRNQALRIPREFELPGDEAIIRREGEYLVIEPVKQQPLLEVLSGLKPLEEDFPAIAELPIGPVNF